MVQLIHQTNQKAAKFYENPVLNYPMSEEMCIVCNEKAFEIEIQEDSDEVPERLSHRQGFLRTTCRCGLLLYRSDRRRRHRPAARCRARLAERADVLTEPGHSTLISFRTADPSSEVVERLRVDMHR